MIPLIRMMKDTVYLVRDSNLIELKCMVVTKASQLFREREVIFHDFDLILITLPKYVIDSTEYEIQTGDLIKVDRLYRVIRVNSYITPDNRVLYKEVYLEVRA